MENKETLFNVLLNICASIDGKRTPASVMLSLTEEIGEVAKEVNAAYNKDSYKYGKIGKDGLIGECVDAMSGLIDIIRLHNSNITEADLIEVAKGIERKWKDKQHAYNEAQGK